MLANSGGTQGRNRTGSPWTQVRLDQPVQDAQLLERLDTFDGHGQAQRARGFHHAPHQVERALAFGDVGEEAAVDLDLVERQGMQIAQAGIAGAKIVQRNADAQLLQLVDVSGTWKPCPRAAPSRSPRFQSLLGRSLFFRSTWAILPTISSFLKSLADKFDGDRDVFGPGRALRAGGLQD